MLPSMGEDKDLRWPEIATPEEAAQRLRQMFGRGAKLAAADIAWTAKRDDRMIDYRFWREVLVWLYQTDPTTPAQTIH